MFDQYVHSLNINTPPGQSTKWSSYDQFPLSKTYPLFIESVKSYQKYLKLSYYFLACETLRIKEPNTTTSRSNGGAGTKIYGGSKRNQ